MHPKLTTKWLVYIREHPWVLGQATGTLDHKTHHDLDSGEASTFPHIVFSAPLRWDYIQMALFPGTPKLESRNCPDWSPHSQFERREEVDSRLLGVGSQTANLTPGPSFAHNLGYRCPNGQCEAIFDIYASRPFQWHQEHLNARCFGPCCRTLNIRESRRTPNPQLWEWEFHPPTSPKIGLRHDLYLVYENILNFWLVNKVEQVACNIIKCDTNLKNHMF
jgi:hypothetical protein